MGKNLSFYSRRVHRPGFYLIAGLVLALTAAVPRGFNFDGGGFPTPTPTTAPDPAPTETPTLVPIEAVFPEPSPTPVLNQVSAQELPGGDNIVASSTAVEDQNGGGFNLLLLGIPFLGVLFVLVVIGGFYMRRSREEG